MNRLEAIELSHKFIKQELPYHPWYVSIEEHIKAILLYGSRAKGTNRPDSDIDLMIIVPLEIEKKYTEGEYSIFYNKQEFNIVLRSIEKLRSIDFNHDDFQKEIFRNSEILFESDDEVRTLISQRKRRWSMTTGVR